VPIRSSRLLLAPLLVALLAALSLALLPGAGEARLPHIPKGLPHFPKVKQYPATIDAAGYVELRWTYDELTPCLPTYAKTVEEEFSFELGRPRRVKVALVGGALVVHPVEGGSAVVASRLSNYKFNNYCHPTPKVPEPPEPSCKTLRGKLGVGLAAVEEESELTPLSLPVVVALYRNGGGAQPGSCLKDRPKLTTVGEDDGYEVQPQGGLTVPLGVQDVKFWRLRVGGKIQRTIAIGGGCEGITARASTLSPHVKHCSIRGKVHVVVKRTG
jgi:hypothetical protein